MQITDCLCLIYCAVYSLLTVIKLQSMMELHFSSSALVGQLEHTTAMIIPIPLWTGVVAPDRAPALD